jgi:uncharacterized protein with HEPN domain
MRIIIKEVNSFMPDVVIKIFEDKIEYTNNFSEKKLKYDAAEIKEIMRMFLEISKGWKAKYEDKGVIDEDIYKISIIGNTTKEIFIKNKYPNNWGDFMSFRNKLIREELKFR